ncbi:MAG TPA: DUF1501 domain-containing protein [Pirellulales bacterium]|nr:DUF1501 domain-containing protein [Pirellulales bacterium]
MADLLPSACPTETTLSRRRLVQLGSLGCLGLSLPSLLQARAAQSAEGNVQPKARIKSCIVIFYFGGPSHIDTFDMKPHAPAEVRGEFKSIATSVPGLTICEHLPRTSRIMHKLALVRSMHHEMRLHDAACVHTLTGRPPARGDGENFVPPDEATLFPSLGASLTYLRRDQRLAVVNAALPYVFRNVVPTPCQTGGFLGSAFNPFQINGDPETMGYQADSLALPSDLPLARVAGRTELLRRLDASADVAQGAASRRLREHYQKAFDLLGSEAVRRALDIEREDPLTRDRYGRVSGMSGAPGATNGAQLGFGRNLRGQNLLLARRLVEAGVPFVNVYDFRQQGQNWDAHSQNFVQHKDHLLPLCDQPLAALIEDLNERGLLDTTLVVALGEFGRTPKINKDAGRDHWPDCYTAVVAGGGVRGGFVYGSSDKLGAYPASDPVSPGDLAATIFTAFGIDPATEIRDTLGRPYRIAEGRPITELFAGAI